jgi:hypothetical protein
MTLIINNFLIFKRRHPFVELTRKTIVLNIDYGDYLYTFNGEILLKVIFLNTSNYKAIRKEG